MAVLEILEYPDKRLKTACQPLERIDDDIRRLAADMAETMYVAPGIGLAATQVGAPVRMLTCDVTAPEEENRLYTVINPRIVEADGKIVYEEGCLSVPGVFEEVERAARITLEYMDLEGRDQVLEAEGLLAICLQHEIDHLDGKLFIDRLSSLKRKLAVRKLERFKEERERRSEDEG